MFSHNNLFQQTDSFNPPISSWNTSQATNFRSMFENRVSFNQNLNNWNTSNVTDMGYMFAGCNSFNQPLNNWDTSNVTNMMWMFHFIPNFNQPLNTWNTAKVTDMSHMFHGCTAFNQPLDNWDTNKVINLSTIFQGAISFNQSLGSWQLPMLTDAFLSITASGLDCDHYSDTIQGWADNPNTAHNINLGPLISLQYSADIVSKRDMLISNGWIFNGDTVGECRKLGTNENVLDKANYIYPNPASDYIYIKNSKEIDKFIITDFSGRIVMADRKPEKNRINIQMLDTGHYILQIITKEKIQSFKFIKK